jgi:DNA-binding winged helix-turn-helix (wHTH) protein/tetratricopeptide (TPR) repeat protein
MDTTVSSQSVICFGVFEADMRSGELRKNGSKIKIQELPFRALKLLLSRPNHILTRDEFRQALWQDGVFVDFDHGISSAINRLRDALGDSAANPVFIETVERRGYRWIAPTYCPDPPKPQQQKTETTSTEPESPVAPAENPPATMSFTARRKWMLVLPVLGLALVLSIYAIRRSTKTGARPTANLSSLNQGQTHHAANREAEDYYLKGRFYWNKRTPESLNQALDAFNQAIAHDPNYSDAYMGLADCYNLLREFSIMPGNEAYFKAYAAAKKAVELDAQSSEAHATLAFASFFGMWDVPDAEKEFRRAIELDPNSPKAHHWYATFLHSLGRREQALTEIDLARKLSPDSPSILADKGELLWAAGHREPALQLLKQLEAADPDFLSPHRYLRFAYLESDNYPDYIAELKKDAQLTHNAAQSAVADAAAKGFAQGGKRGLLEAELVEQKKLHDHGKLSPYFVAQTNAELGHTREALQYLTACVQSHDELVLNLGADQSFASLHSDPAFEKLLARIGLPSFH